MRDGDAELQQQAWRYQEALASAVIGEVVPHAVPTYEPSISALRTTYILAPKMLLTYLQHCPAAHSLPSRCFRVTCHLLSCLQLLALNRNSCNCWSYRSEALAQAGQPKLRWPPSSPAIPLWCFRSPIVVHVLITPVDASRRAMLLASTLLCQASRPQVNSKTCQHLSWTGSAARLPQLRRCP